MPLFSRGRRSDSDPGDFAGDIADVRIYSLPLAKAEIAADMHGSKHGFALQGAAGLDHGPPPRPEDRKEECSFVPDPEDEKIPGGAATLGVLAAIACVGLFQSSGQRRCLIASLAAGLLLIPATAPALPTLTRWMMLLVTLAGGASVAFTISRQERSSSS
jgi:hypothetical protein